MKRLSKFLNYASGIFVQDVRKHSSQSIISMASTTDTLCRMDFFPFALVPVTVISKHLFFACQFRAYVAIREPRANSDTAICGHKVQRDNCLRDVNHAPEAFLCTRFIFVVFMSHAPVLVKHHSAVGLRP